MEVYALNSSGKRTHKIPVTKTAENYTKFNISEDYCAFNYEVVKSNDNFITVNANQEKEKVTINGWMGYGMADKTFNVSFTDATTGEIVYSSDLVADEFGQYEKVLSLNDKLKNGSYNVKVSYGSYSSSETLDYIQIGMKMFANVSGNKNTITVSGNLLYEDNEGEKILSGSKVSVIVKKSDEIIDPLKSINIYNASKLLYLIEQTKTDKNGNFKLDIKMNDSPSGNYNIMVTAENDESYITKNIIHKYVQVGMKMSVDACSSDDMITLSGNLLYEDEEGKKALPDSNVSVIVKKSDEIVDPSKPINDNNASNILYFVEQTKTDENGVYEFSVNMKDAPSGSYHVMLTAESDESYITKTIVYNYEGSLPEYELKFYDNADKINEVVTIVDLESITAVAEKNVDKNEGELILVITKDGKMEEAITEKTNRNSDGELYITYKLPTDKTGYGLNLFYWNDMNKLVPLAKAVKLP